MTSTRDRRPALTEWAAFSGALSEVMAAAGINKSALAGLVDADRRVVGSIVEGRDPCPEWFLMRLHDKCERLGGSDHLQILTERWAQASGAAPEFVAYTTPPPTPAGDRQQGAVAGVEVEDHQRRSRTSRSRCLIAVILVAVAGLAVLGLASPLSTQAKDRQATPVTHVFPADYAGVVHVIVEPDGATQPLRVVLDWGSWHREVHLDPSPEGTLLVFTKVDSLNTVPLRVRTFPSARLTFGTGNPSPATGLDINEGWRHR